MNYTHTHTHTEAEREIGHELSTTQGHSPDEERGGGWEGGDNIAELYNAHIDFIIGCVVQCAATFWTSPEILLRRNCVWVLHI